MKNNTREKFRCPCCGYITLTTNEPLDYEICPICFWENDPIQNDDENYRGGANTISLSEARANFVNLGASQKRFICVVRKPFENEIY